MLIEYNCMRAIPVPINSYRKVETQLKADMINDNDITYVNK